jgi:hypothetical protein
MASAALGLAVMTGASGCSMDEKGVDLPPSVSAQLGNPTPLTLALDGSAVHLQGEELPIESGEVKLGAYYYHGNVIELDALDVTFDTMHVKATAPGLENYEVRHARVSLARPVVAPVEWTSHGDAGFATLKVELLLDWSVVGPTGIEVQLATQHLTEVEVELDIYATADGTLTAALYGAKPGIFWSWAGVATMGDLHFDLRAQRQPIIN